MCFQCLKCHLFTIKKQTKQVLSEEKITELESKIPKYLWVWIKHPNMESTYRINAKPVQHRQGKLQFRLHLEDLHDDAFSFFTPQYCMSLNGSAFIY